MYLVKIEGLSMVPEAFVLNDLELGNLALIAMNNQSLRAYCRNQVFAKLVETALDVQVQEDFDLDICLGEFYVGGVYRVSLQAKPDNTTVWGLNL